LGGIADDNKMGAGHRHIRINIFINNEVLGISMTLGSYLLSDVQHGEYVLLKSDRERIISSMLAELSSHWKLDFDWVNLTFKYNMKNHTIGIFLEKDGKEQLVQNKEDLDDAENSIVRSLYTTLERRIGEIRFPKDEWI